MNIKVKKVEASNLFMEKTIIVFCMGYGILCMFWMWVRYKIKEGDHG